MPGRMAPASIRIQLKIRENQKASLEMNPLFIGFLSAVCIFFGGLVGLWLQRLLPQQHLSKEMQDLVKLSAGTIATLTALVLGLLVSSAKSSFDAINTGIVQGGAKIIFLDRNLARYGSEAQPAREQLKRSVAVGLEEIWPSEKTGVPELSAFERRNGMEVVQDKLATLVPRNSLQGQELNQARQLVSDIGQARWLLVEEIHTGLPMPLLGILVFWLMLLFVSFGLFAPRNRMAFVVLAIGACAISAAIFLVLELNRPFTGLIRISSAPMRAAFERLGN